jgi:hypothetical protein
MQRWHRWCAFSTIKCLHVKYRHIRWIIIFHKCHGDIQKQIIISSEWYDDIYKKYTLYSQSFIKNKCFVSYFDLSIQLLIINWNGFTMDSFSIRISNIDKNNNNGMYNWICIYIIVDKDLRDSVWTFIWGIIIFCSRIFFLSAM